MTIPRAFLDALVSRQRAPEIAEMDDLFGFLIGSWDLDAILHGADGTTRKVRGELHAAWVLEGRAIQDLFIFPRRSDRSPDVSVHGDRYATTIRTYDRTLKAWRVDFINPAAEETSARLIARRRVSDIEMEGTLSGGVCVRWRYGSITPTSFQYRAEKLLNDSKSWQVYLELFGTRAVS
jgi:hypothetical protein